MQPMAEMHTEEFRELPVTAAPVPSRAGQIDAALSALEGGMFAQAAQLCDTLLRDDRIAGCLSTRLNGLLGLPLDIKPADEDDPLATRIAAELEDKWDKLFPDATLAEIKRWAIMVGVGPVELLWQTAEGDPLSDGYRWWPRLKTWHPQFMWWDAWTRTYLMQTADGSAVTVTPGDGTWAMYAPRGTDRAWLFGLVRCLAAHWLRRAWAYRDFSRKSEVNGQAIRKAIVPAQASKTQKSAFFSAVANLGAETTIRCDQEPGNDGAKFDMQLLEAQAAGHDLFVKILDKVETNIAIALLGQNLSTEVQGGSYAAATAHEQIRADFKRFDASTLSQWLREEVLKPWCAYNFGDAELAPYIEWQTDPPEDSAAQATALKDTALAIQAFVAAGAPVDLRAMLDVASIPVLDEAEVADAPSGEHPQTIGAGEQTEEPLPGVQTQPALPGNLETP